MCGTSCVVYTCNYHLQTALTVALINKRYYNYTAIVYYENIALLLIMKGAIYVKGFGL